MASRCINALNELDAISDKIFYKYSENRLKQEIATKVKDSKCRAERNASQADSQPRKCSSRKSICSNRSSNISTTTNNSNVKSSGSKSTSNIKTSIKHYQNSRKSQSSTSKKPTHTSSETTTAETVHNASSERNFTPSIFGKFTPGASVKTGKWFNFKDGVDQGVIDSFECDKLNERALCYQVNVEESKAVPKLLRHRLEVRIGRNGDVRNEDVEMKCDNWSSEGTQDKRLRTVPLSWEEQLNWKNAQIIEPRTHKVNESTDEGGLCETHPVIFNHESNHQRLSNTTNISNKATLSYRLYMDKKLVNDRRNLTCGLKCVTSVQFEDGSSDVRKVGGNPITRTKSHDSDLMDMSNTIKNMEKIYRTFSQESERKALTLETTVVEENEGSEDQVVENNIHHEKPPDTEIVEEQEQESVKINKKVSFKDDLEGKEVLNIIAAQRDNFKPIETRNPGTNQNTKRPSSSKARSNLVVDQEFKVDKPRRPYTAPPCSPTTPNDSDFPDKMTKSSHVKQLVPILVPTSNYIEVSSENEIEPKKGPETPEDKEEIHDIRVTFGCKSAPTVRNTIQEEPIERSLSTTTARIKTEKYSRPPPTAILDNSNPIELSTNIPPGQALIELRKKVRENLAKETADLQLDIQQLYIKHHSYRS